MIELDRMANSARVTSQSFPILIITQILSENEVTTRFGDPQQVAHAFMRVANMVQNIDHDTQIEIIVGKGKFFQRVIIQDTASLAVELSDKCQLEFYVGSYERI